MFKIKYFIKNKFKLTPEQNETCRSMMGYVRDPKTGQKITDFNILQKMYKDRVSFHEFLWCYMIYLLKILRILPFRFFKKNHYKTITINNIKYKI